MARIPSLLEVTLGVRSKIYGSFDCRTDIIAIHDARLMYFAVPKVANSSFKRVLAQAIPGLPASQRAKSYGANNTVFSDPAIRRWLRKHRVLLCKHQVPAYSDYRRVAFVRNPWDRLVSCYKQKLDHQIKQNGRLGGTARSLADAGLYKPDITFTEFVHAVAQIPDPRSNRHFRSQSSFLVDHRGEPLYSELRFFEELDAGFRYLRDRLGRPELELPHLKKTERHDYRAYYTQETADIVAQRYARDLELFGYTF